MLTHARQRAKERYGIELSDDAVELMTALAREKYNAQAFPRTLKRQMRLWYDDRVYRVVYNAKKDQLSTFLPLKKVGDK